MVQSREGLIGIASDFNKVSWGILARALRGRARIVRLTGNEVCYRSRFRGIDWGPYFYSRANRVLCLVLFPSCSVNDSVEGYANPASREGWARIRVLAWSGDIIDAAGLFQ